jgi:hypothetical protein
MEDHEIHEHIGRLVEEERELRSHSKAGHPLDEAERDRIAHLEVHLDQLWDLLRRRQAREEFGQDPATEAERPAEVVEHYRQ